LNFTVISLLVMDISWAAMVSQFLCIGGSKGGGFLTIRILRSFLAVGFVVFGIEESSVDSSLLMHALSLS